MLKIIVLAIILSIIVLLLKNINSDIYPLALIGAEIFFIIYTITYITDSLEIFRNLINLTGIDNNYIKIILKVVSIGYLVEIGANLIEDFGYKSLSNILVFVGKAVIIATAFPVIYSFIDIIIKLQSV